MKHSFWGYFVVVCGLVIVVILLLVQRMTTTNEEDFYLAREVLESSMIDAVDYGTYRTTGRLVMSEQKFVEVFIRRFAESVTNNKTYELDFYDIYEEPPKASVRVRTSSGDTANIKDTVFDVNLDTLVSGILETIYSQADTDGNGGNGGDTTTVACPDGGHKTIHYTPNNPDGGDDDGDDDDVIDSSDLVTSGVITFYSVGYLDNKDAYDAQNKKCLSTNNTGGMDFPMTYKSLPNGLGEDIESGRIKKCEVIVGSAQAFNSAKDITEYKKYHDSLGQYLLNYNGGGIYDSTLYNFNYYATSAEISNISVKCDPVVKYDADGKEYGTVDITLKYESVNKGRSTANNNVVLHAVAENKRDVYCFIYTGVKWNMKFWYTKN